MTGRNSFRYSVLSSGFLRLTIRFLNAKNILKRPDSNVPRTPTATDMYISILAFIIRLTMSIIKAL